MYYVGSKPAVQAWGCTWYGQCCQQTFSWPQVSGYVFQDVSLLGQGHSAFQDATFGWHKLTPCRAQGLLWAFSTGVLLLQWGFVGCSNHLLVTASTGYSSKIWLSSCHSSEKYSWLLLKPTTWIVKNPCGIFIYLCICSLVWLYPRAAKKDKKKRQGIRKESRTESEVTMRKYQWLQKHKQDTTALNTLPVRQTSSSKCDKPCVSSPLLLLSAVGLPEKEQHSWCVLPGMGKKKSLSYQAYWNQQSAFCFWLVLCHLGDHS